MERKSLELKLKTFKASVKMSETNTSISSTNVITNKLFQKTEKSSKIERDLKGTSCRFLGYGKKFRVR